MNRSLPPPARALRVLTGLLVLGAAACTPNNGVKPGAPELIEFIVVQNGGPTIVTPDTPDCATAQATGDACHPNGVMADAADGGTNDADIPPDTLCRQTADMTDDNYTYSWAGPIVNGTPSDLKYAKDISGAPITKNPNYGHALLFQRPFNGRFGLRLTF